MKILLQFPLSICWATCHRPPYCLRLKFARKLNKSCCFLFFFYSNGSQYLRHNQTKGTCWISLMCLSYTYNIIKQWLIRQNRLTKVEEVSVCMYVSPSVFIFSKKTLIQSTLHLGCVLLRVQGRAPSSVNSWDLWDIFISSVATAKSTHSSVLGGEPPPPINCYTTEENCRVQFVLRLSLQYIQEQMKE